MPRLGLGLLIAAVFCLAAPGGTLGSTADRPPPAQRLHRILPPDQSLQGRGPEHTVRANRVAAALTAHRHTPETQEAARQFLARFVESGRPTAYHAAAGMAVLALREAARTRRLMPEELQVLRQLSGRFSIVQALAELLCAEAGLHGAPEAERLATYERLLARDTPSTRHAFLILNGGSAPRELQRHWQGGDRFAATGRLAYEGSALQHYYRLRRREFPSASAEVAFLWSRVDAHYRRLVTEPHLPHGEEGYRYQEARAATARLIEIGEPAVRFLLSRPERLLSLANPDDLRALDGDLFALWIVRALPRKEFVPVLRQLAVCRSLSVQRAATDALERIEAENPYPYHALYVFHFKPPPGLD